MDANVSLYHLLNKITICWLKVIAHYLCRDENNAHNIVFQRNETGSEAC